MRWQLRAGEYSDAETETDSPLPAYVAGATLLGLPDPPPLQMYNVFVYP